MVNKLAKTLLALMLAGTVACSAAAISVSAAANSTAQTSAAALSSYDSILKDIEALPAPQKKAADVDYNNAITVTDVTLIQKYISGSISQFNGLSAYSMNVESCKSVKTVKLIDPVEKSKVSVSTACPNSDINWLSAKTVADANGMVSEIEVTAYINNSGKARTGTVYVKIERSVYSLKVTQPKYILENKTKLGASVITLGKTVSITTAADYEYDPVKYKITYRKDGEKSVTLCDFSDKTVKSFKPAAYGNYTIGVWVKDNNNKTVYKSFSLKVGLEKGDVNGDGNVNINDVTMIQKALAEYITLDEFQKKAADFDGDGRVTVSDATALQKKLAEL